MGWLAWVEAIGPVDAEPPPVKVTGSVTASPIVAKAGSPRQWRFQSGEILRDAARALGRGGQRRRTRGAAPVARVYENTGRGEYARPEYTLMLG